MPGELGEDCLSPRAVGLCEGEFRGRPAWRVAQGGVGEPGAAFFWLLFLAEQEK